MDSHSPALAARSAAPTGAAFARPMTPDEAAHLDRLREWLHGDGTDATDAAALDARWARLLATHPPEAPAPAGVAAAIGIAVGDLLVASVTDAVWRMCPGPEGATPGVLLPERPQMPVLPVLDAHARWRVRSPEWTVDYVERAAAHLRRLRPAVPTPHPAPEAAAPAEPDEPADVPAADVAPVEETPAQPAAWTPTFVEDAAPAASEPEPAAWTPTVVEETAQPEPAAWTPAFVEEPAPAEPEPAAWTPTVVEETAQPEPAAWTPTFADEPAPAEPQTEESPWTPAIADEPVEAEPTAWTPTIVEDTTPAEPEPAAWTPTFADEPTETEPAAWTPTIVEDSTATEPEPAAWTPTFVEDTAEPEPAAWTPTFVEDTGESDDRQAAWSAPAVEETHEPEHAAWTPTFAGSSPVDAEAAHHEVLDALAAPLTGAVAVVDEPAAWTPSFVEDAAPAPVDAEPVTSAEPVAYAEPAAAEPTTHAEPVASAEPVEEELASPDPSVMPWDATASAATYPTPGRGMPVVPEHTLTPEDLPHRPSERVQDLALRALELALDRAVRDVAGSAPFVLVREGYDVEVREFPHSDEGVSLARAAAREGGYSAAAVAWTSPADASRPYPRVVVDASSAGRPGIRVAHSFLHDEQGGHEVGGPQVVGQSAPVL